jgi:hypothetical protein
MTTPLHDETLAFPRQTQVLRAGGLPGCTFDAILGASAVRRTRVAPGAAPRPAAGDWRGA